MWTDPQPDIAMRGYKIPHGSLVPFSLCTTYCRDSFYTVENTPEIFPFGQKCLLYINNPVIPVLPWFFLKTTRPGFTARSSASGSDGKGHALFLRDFVAWAKNHLENLAFRPLTMPL